VHLTSDGGASVELRPLAYQFPDLPGNGGDDWDANWLVVRGDVRLADGRGWSFVEPCLTTWEARSLGSWLRAVVAGEVEPSASVDEDALLAFAEPNVALSVAARSGGSAVVRVHLSLESRPPWLGPDVELFHFVVELDLPLPALTAAADDWDRELSAFPAR
jgi:hypothetical protein